MARLLGRGGGEGGEREREKERERREKESREGAIATDWLNLQIGSRHRRNNVGRARGGQKGSLSGDAGWNAVVICSLVGEEEEEKEEEGAHRAVVRIFFWKLQYEGWKKGLVIKPALLLVTLFRISVLVFEFLV